MKLDTFKGCVFFFWGGGGGKSKNGFVISDQWILQRQKNAKFEKGLFSMPTETNKPRVACNLEKKKCVNWFVLEKFLIENATRKKKKP